jgi:hypothetical protein
VAKQALGGEPDLWHVHNHSLGKTPALPMATKALGEAGRRLLLQIHDFAEDGRPGDFRRLSESLGRGNLDAALYPQSDHIHYAVLNGRDRDLLGAVGVSPDRLHFLPNAVEALPAFRRDAAEGDGRLFLYPARGIRRKNVGEILLWSALASEGDRFAVTRAPRNPHAKPVYDRWVAFAKLLDLPVTFEAGEAPGVTLEGLFAQAHTVVTTSVAEGFGLCFLEPWTCRRALAGRDLPEVTGLFSDAGMSFTAVYEELPVPVDWLGREHVMDRLVSGLRSTWRAYGRERPDTELSGMAQSMMHDGVIDFGRLDEPMQEQVIRQVREFAQARAEFGAATPGALDEDAGRIAHNRDVVLTEFGLEQYGDRLVDIYSRVAGASAGALHAGSVDKLLDGFLDPQRFTLLRSAPPAEE